MRDALTGRCWTADEVASRLVAAMGESLGAGKACEVPGLVFTDAAGNPVRAGEWIKLAAAKLGRNRGAEQLMAWARSRAGIGPSVRATCGERQWPRSTFYYRRRRLCAELADALTQRG